MNNKVIIIGNDHANTLGVIRTFGEKGIMPYVIFISDTKFIGVKKSKYIKNFWICSNEEEAILTMVDEFSKKKDKLVVIPTSDKIVSVLDLNYNKLKDKFIYNNINGTQKEINRLMNKYEQFLLANKNKIPMAKSMVISYPFKNNNIHIKYPIIIKPLFSIDGVKDDITIIKNSEELEKNLSLFTEKKYTRLLLQEVIDYDYEIDVSGFSFNNKVSMPGYIKKERIWPIKTGSTTYGKILPIDTLPEIKVIIKKIFENIKYNGIFDIDIFISHNKIYINEINFRNGALSYAYGNSSICYYYYLSCIKNKFIPSPTINNEYFFIDDQADLHNVFEKNITYKIYKKSCKKALIKLYEDKKDKQPALYLFIYKLLKKIKLFNILTKIK